MIATQQCKQCLLLKTRIKTGKLDCKGYPTYMELSGRPWKGKVCASCYSKKQMILNKKAAITGVFNTQLPSKRKCLKCKEYLMDDRYFTHVACTTQAAYSTEYEDYVYV